MQQVRNGLTRTCPSRGFLEDFLPVAFARERSSDNFRYLRSIYSTGLVYTYNITSPTVTLQPTNLLRELSYFECEAGFRPRRHPWRCAELIKIECSQTHDSVSSQCTWERTTPKAHAQNKRARFINVEVEAGSVKWKCEMKCAAGVRSRSAIFYMHA